jgi:hypothetical protein
MACPPLSFSHERHNGLRNSATKIIVAKGVRNNLATMGRNKRNSPATAMQQGATTAQQRHFRPAQQRNNPL